MRKVWKPFIMFLSFSLFLGVAPFTRAAPADAVSGNLVKNGDFQRNTAGWSTSSGASLTVVWSAEGADANGGCLKITYPPGSTGNNGNPGHTQRIALERDQWYLISCKVKIDDFTDDTKTPLSKANATIYLLNLDEIDTRNPAWHVYAQVAKDTPLNIVSSGENGGLISTGWTEVKGYYKYSGKEEYDNSNCDIQIRVGDSSTLFSYAVDDVAVYQLPKLANGGFEDVGYSTKGQISQSDACYTRFAPWKLETDANTRIVGEAAHTGAYGALINEGGTGSALTRGVSQYISIKMNEVCEISAWVKLKDPAAQGDYTRIQAQLLLTHDTFYTNPTTLERTKGDIGTQYLVTLNDISDGEWHQLKCTYNAADWNYSGKAINPFGASGYLFPRVQMFTQAGVQNTPVPFYIDDFQITTKNITVTKPELIGENENIPIETLTETDKLFGRVNITNTTGSEKSCNIILAGYDGKGILKKIMIEKVTLRADELYKSVKTAGYLPIEDGITKVKAMVWDPDVSRAIPLTGTAELSGDYNVINNTLKKLNETGEITVGYLGGSITAGAGASPSSNGYAYITTQWLRERFPNSTINLAVAALGGTGSDLGAMRVGEELLSKNPDLVFIEFAVNDFGRAVTKNCIEGIIRQVKQHNPLADIIFLNSFCIPMLSDYQKGELPKAVQYNNEVAAYYGCGSVNMGKDLYNAIAAENRTEPGYYMSDNSHPTNAGHAHYRDSIAAYLERMIRQADLNAQPKTMPAPMTDYWTGSLVDVGSDSVVRTGSWVQTQSSPNKAGLHNLLESRTPGDSMELAFNGTGIGLYLRVAPDTGIINYQIDGGEISAYDTSDQYTRSGSDRIFYKFLATNLNREAHTIKIWVSGTKNAVATDCYVRIGAFMVKD